MTVDRVEFTFDAADELDELVEYIDVRNPDAARRVRRDVMDAVAALADEAPRLDGPPVTLRSGDRCFRWFVHPVVVFYEREPGVVRVLRVLHHAREPITR
ncbi:MAG: type II toxin-antitoxin system RelE/ParE family toxin [Deltaproteobacteria bacterium]|nr:type II toxin-antitoxin system RelE/ParE family toxin [Myxococcales bacterium]MDP3212562.1 type II toxin-antitoxin system RelE/ParE family toxin [Deltaproteobacteria bacterium]